MSIHQRIWDDDAFLRPGEEMPQPLTVSRLCTRLGVEGEPDDVRAAAVTLWLSHNTANANLQASIELSG